MDKESFLSMVREMRQKAVDELCRDEELGRYFLALEKLDEIEAKAQVASAKVVATATGAR